MNVLDGSLPSITGFQFRHSCFFRVVYFSNSLNCENNLVALHQVLCTEEVSTLMEREYIEEFPLSRLLLKEPKPRRMKEISIYADMYL